METDKVGSPEWKALLARARAALDEQGQEDYEKRRAGAARRSARFCKLTGMAALPYDFYLIQEALVRYDDTKELIGACRSVGVKLDFVREAMGYDADVKLVYDFIEDNLENRFAVRAREIASKAQESLEALVTDGECKVNQRSVEYALKSGAKKVYGEDEAKEGRSSARQVVYNLPNANINLLINPPADKAALEMVAQEAAVDAEVLG